MFDSFYEAFADELSKVGMRDPNLTFDSWRDRFERTGKKRIGELTVPKGMEEHAMPKPRKRASQVKSAAIYKRVSATPTVVI